jgi:hypothetical protein
MSHEPPSAGAETERVILRHLGAHNRRVALLSVLTLLAAVALWYLLYGTASWLTLLFVTAVKGTDAFMPGIFPTVFWSVSAGLLVLAWIERWLHPDDRPKDHKNAAEIVLELILAVPRLTLAVWGTLSAWQHLTRWETAAAAGLIDRLASEHRLRLQSIPLEIPDAKSRFKILFALQLVQVIDIRREDRELWVMLNALRPKGLGGGRPPAETPATAPGRD